MQRCLFIGLGLLGLGCAEPRTVPPPDTLVTLGGGGAAGAGTDDPEPTPTPAAGGVGGTQEPASCTALVCQDGELTGTWRFEQACPEEYSADWDTLPSSCDQPQTHDEYDGTLTFDADGTVTRDYTLTSTQYRLLNIACVVATSKADNLSNGACALFDKPADQFGSAVVCTFTGSACRCDWTLVPSTVKSTDAYARGDYCLQGDELTFAVPHYAEASSVVQNVVTLHLRRDR